ncbi:tRNA dihydrouridine(20/20a) synthase DusA [Pararhodospirillum oryzae]|uniref:tRNA-dihydrouridine(20/20a) synthase n=1 Tax=Pararhodospirillum oryzae TaxID=478448 RepID=A0A512H6R0_9PROT|nr:tRNA dihydrouridine(20/20a) synthase DusA [Pararhodospirillum oryzae]GEO81156.1 tRNA-dihydrouridine(20/20a) synthase [Pararhodospirillum oryzae]
MTIKNNRLCVAPMLDWTDRHDRWFLRRLTRHALLYTEMVTTAALLHADPARFLDHHPEEQPLALQLGGSTPEDLARSVRLAQPWGFAEINLNVGCPSDRVSKGRFGACLMAEPTLVAECLAAMIEAQPGTPMTVKHRIGIDDLDSYEALRGFVETVARAGVGTFIVHARKAWLNGLSPRENRTVPPLRHDVVHRLKADFPNLDIVLNGGITSVDEALAHMSPAFEPPEGQSPVDGVMIGRAAYETPFILALADRRVFGTDTPLPDRHAVVRALVPYAERMVARGEPVHRLTRHVLGLFHGCPGARAFRRTLGEAAARPGAPARVLLDALALVPEPVPEASTAPFFVSPPVEEILA